MKDKSEKFSVSFPLSLLEAMDAHIGTTPRSRWLQDLTTDRLRSIGALHEDPVAVALTRAREVIAAQGLDAFSAKLDEMTASAVAVAGGGE